MDAIQIGSGHGRRRQRWTEATLATTPPGVVDLTIVVPALNEELRLGATLGTVGAHLSAFTERAGLSWELIVVDDGSTDGTAQVAERAARADPRVTVLYNLATRGKGGAIRRGIAASHGRQVLFTDADLATPIAELGRLRAALDGGHAAAIGSRARPSSRIHVHQHPAREVLGRLGNRVIRAVAVPGIVDTQCGFKLFDGPKARLVFGLGVVDGWAFDVEVLRMFQRFGWSVAEVPVDWSHRPGSKVRPLDYLRVLTDVLRLRVGRLSRRPAGRGSGPDASAVRVVSAAPSALVRSSPEQHPVR